MWGCASVASVRASGRTAPAPSWSAANAGGSCLIATIAAEATVVTGVDDAHGATTELTADLVGGQGGDDAVMINHWTRSVVPKFGDTASPCAALDLSFSVVAHEDAQPES